MDEAVAILRQAKDRDELTQTAVGLARSKNPKALEHLMAFLLGSEFWNRLDDDPKSPRRLAKVLTAIGQMATPQAEEALLKFATDEQFMAYDAAKRIRSLFDAFGEIHRPSTKLMAFLEYETIKGEEKYNVQAAMRTLAKMGTPESAALFEKRLLSSAFKRDRYPLICHDLLCHRNWPANVELLKRLLNLPLANKEDHLHWMIVTALFYQYNDLHKSRQAGNHEPPPRQYAPTEVLEELVRIADRVPQLDIPEEAKRVVTREKKAIQRILDFRYNQGPTRVRRWIAELDHDEFQVRQQAEQELAKVLDFAELALKKALKANPSPEAQRRLERLLEQIPKPPIGYDK
jgi:hypothetical protein